MKYSSIIVMMVLPFMFSCSTRNGNTNVMTGDIEDTEQFTSNDLMIFEVHGHVMQINHISYLEGSNIIKQGKDFHSVKALSEYHPLIERFDKRGRWTNISEKDLKRDSVGRIVFRLDPEGDIEYEWKDSLITCYIDDHNSRYVYEYDEDGKKIKETYFFKDPNKQNSSFVKQSVTNYHYTKWDDRGNWTERWCDTYYEGEESPKNHVDLREIEYYK